jgi:tryptophanyl-tRNA synthetase
MSAEKPRETIFSGIQPSGELHLGNYLGAIRNWVALQDSYRCFYCIVDYHAITQPFEPAEIGRRVREMACDLIACGIDPAKSTLFVQSAVPEHTELAWALSSVASYGELGRMTQFKDKSEKSPDNINAGLFTYPVLQAADILIYHATKVPVGEDQRQHLEITRDLAERMNARFGPVLTVPEPYILKESAKIMDLQEPTSKMSGSLSSDKGLVLLSDDPGRIAKKIRSAVTDTEAEVRYDPETKPGVSNLLVIHSVLSGTPVAEVEADFAGRGYGDLKKAVAEVVVDAVTPFRERMAELLDDPAELDRLLARGAERAAVIADATMTRVRDAVGLLPAAE